MGGAQGGFGTAAPHGRNKGCSEHGGCSFSGAPALLPVGPGASGRLALDCGQRRVRTLRRASPVIRTGGRSHITAISEHPEFVNGSCLEPRLWWKSSRFTFMYLHLTWSQLAIIKIWILLFAGRNGKFLFLFWVMTSVLICLLLFWTSPFLVHRRSSLFLPMAVNWFF